MTEPIKPPPYPYEVAQLRETAKSFRESGDHGTAHLMESSAELLQSLSVSISESVTRAAHFEEKWNKALDQNDEEHSTHKRIEAEQRAYAEECRRQRDDAQAIADESARELVMSCTVPVAIDGEEWRDPMGEDLEPDLGYLQRRGLALVDDASGRVRLVEPNRENEIGLPSNEALRADLDRMQVIGVDKGSPDGDCTVKGYRDAEGRVHVTSVERSHAVGTIFAPIRLRGHFMQETDHGITLYYLSGERCRDLDQFEEEKVRAAFLAGRQSLQGTTPDPVLSQVSKQEADRG